MKPVSNVRPATNTQAVLELSLPKDFTTLTQVTAEHFAAYHKHGGDAAKTLLRQAIQYTKQLRLNVTEFVQCGNDINADEFAKDANRSLANALRQAQVEHANAAASAIVRVGCFLVHIPIEYGECLLGSVLQEHGSEHLQWAHFAQLARLAECGPLVMPNPKLIPWLDVNEGKNSTIMREHQASLEEKRKIWRAVAWVVVCSARSAIDANLTPGKLEVAVNKRLKRRPRGRPPKPVIDPTSKIFVPQIEF